MKQTLKKHEMNSKTNKMEIGAIQIDKKKFMEEIFQDKEVLSEADYRKVRKNKHK